MIDADVVERIADVDPAAWDRLSEGADNPFVEHAFLAALEDSGSVGGESGWAPRFVVARRRGALVGAAPAWLRADSYGEYMFDWAWAQAAQRAGMRYYPKITVAVPYTPATGPRLMVAPGEDGDLVRAALVAGLEALRAREGASSIHALFCDDDEATFLAARGWARRAALQFHFRNPGYASFDALLATFDHGARKNVKRERRRVVEAAVAVDVVRGDALSPDEAGALWDLYASTIDRKWGRPYLTRAFFRLLPTTLGARAVVARARLDGRVVAASLSFEKGGKLYGRHYGAPREIPGVHFELCYYRLLERAIERGMLLVEAGAQGEHKLARGFLPVIVHGAHSFADARFGAAIARFCAEERAAVHEEQAAYLAHAPFKEGAAPPFPLVAGTALQKQS